MTDPSPRLEELFAAGVELPAERRAAWLDEACRHDAALRRRLEALLAADAASADGGLAEPLLSRASEQMPVRVGPFTPTRVLGEGGMGVVFEATQQGTGRTVALKLIRAGLASPGGVRRFRQEAELLARLNDPGIAQVFDAGSAAATYADGAVAERLYLAMEYVEGLDLLAHAEQASLSSRARLELVEQIARAVHHAHQRRVIHRDLKPSNIRVTPAGVAKVLDFGIARLVNPTRSDEATLTGQVMGTAQYMSPEQAEGDTTRIDTRTDIYALGVILYELMAGRPPHDLSGLNGLAAARVAAERDPPRLASVAPQTRGDIDAITHKAIARDPAQRYQSAAEFAADIRRHLDDEPIVARPPSRLESARRFARRNRALVGGIAATIVALAAGVVAATRYAIIAAASERESRWESYRLAITAADASLHLGDFTAARRALDSAPPEHRGWEHAHLRRRPDQWLLEFEDSRSAQGRPCVIRGGERVLSALADGRVGVWEVATGARVATLDLGAPVVTLSSTAPGGTGAAATADRRVLLFAVEDGAVALTADTGGDRPLKEVSFDGEGKRLCAWGDGHLVVLDASDGSVLLRRDRHRTAGGHIGDPFRGGALSADGARLALATHDVISQAEVDTDRVLGRIVRQSFFCSLALAPDGSALVGSTERSVHIVSPTEWELGPALTGHRGQRVVDALPLPDQQAITVDALGQSEDSLHVDRTIRRWDLRLGRQIGVQALPPGGDAVRLALVDGDRFITGGAGGAGIPGAPGMLLWHRDALESTVVGRHANYVYAVAWSPDGRLLASYPFRVPGVPDAVRIWDVAARREVAQVRAAGGDYRTLAFSRDGSRLLAQTGDRADTVSSWETQTWTLAEADLPDPAVPQAAGGEAGLRLHRGACYSPDGTISALHSRATPYTPPTFAVVGAGGGLFLPGDERAVAFSPDGSLVAVGFDAHIGLYSTRTFKEVRRLDPGIRPRALDFSPDGRRLAIVGFSDSIHLFDTQRWERVLDLRGHEATIHDVRFSPDGRSLATCSSDRTVRVWRTAEGE